MPKNIVLCPQLEAFKTQLAECMAQIGKLRRTVYERLTAADINFASYNGNIYRALYWIRKIIHVYYE